MYFETRATDNKKIFTIKFPIDALLTLQWPEEDLALLKQYDESKEVSDKLKMLAMIAENIENRGGETKELVSEPS